MDISLANVLLQLNRTRSPPNNVSVNNHQQLLLSRTTETQTILNNTGAMEPNNISETVTGEAALTAARDSAQTTDVNTGVITAPATEQNLALKLPLLSSSSSDSETESPTNAAVGTSVVGDGDRTYSPPPNCAICLGRCKNKCFTDSCMHQFCFKCLCEWSKVKPECPLCKQTFKSIIHNVKSIHQFEEYHVQPPTVQIAHSPFEMGFQEMRIFGVVHPGSHTGSIPSASGSGNRSMALSGNGGSLRNQYVYRGELLDLYRQDNPGAIANSGTLSQLWRRYVYDRKLYAMPVADITGRFRECSARFYRDNPSQIHRLMPWINRDIVCLLRQTQHDVTTVLESINSALTLLNILSPAFRRRLQPYLGTKTAHFIHELYNFARSPYDMIGYDRAVQYSPQTNEEIVIEFTSSDESTDNEHVDVAGDLNRGATTISTRSSRSTNASSINAINLTIHNRLTSSASSNTLAGGQSGGNAADIPDDVSLVIDLRGESDNNETISTGQATISSSIGQHIEVGDVVVSSVQQPTVAENIELTSGSTDECEFILERKPPHLRTPEMVSLDSASDSDVVFVDESKPLNKTSFSSSDDDHCNDNRQRDLHNHQHHQHNTRNSASTSTRSQITALVEAKKRNHTDNLVKSEQKDSQTEIYNLGASTSAALRLSLQNRNNKSKRSEGSSRSRRSRREKYSLRNNERQMPKNKRGKHLDSESSHSSTSTNTSSIATNSFSDNTSSTGLSTSYSDEDYVTNLPQRRRKSSAGRADSSNRRRKTKKNKTSKTNNSSISYSRAKRESIKRKPLNTDTSSEDDDEENNGHMGKNFALVMAINERLLKQQNQSKRLSKKNSENIPVHTARKQIEDENESEGENSWRLEAVNEHLRRQQQQEQRVKSSLRSNERKRPRKSTKPQEQPRRRMDTYREKDEFNDKITKRRSKIEKPTASDSETGKPRKIRKFNYDDSSSSDESDNINLIQLKTKLNGQDQQSKEVAGDIKNVPHTHIEQNREPTDASSNAQATNNMTGTETEMATENLETHTIIPIGDTTSETNEKQINKFPSTSHNKALSVKTAPTLTEENNSIESLFKTDFHNSSDDSNADDDNEDNGQNKGKHSNDNETSANNDNHKLHNIIEKHQQLRETSSSLANYNSAHISNQQDSYHSDVTEEYDDNRNNDEYNINDVDLVPSKASLNTNLNVFADATSMTSTTTNDTILHDAAEQIPTAAVNFYNSQQQRQQKQHEHADYNDVEEEDEQQHQQQPFNTADFADENSTNTSSSSDTSLISSSSSTSSSSSSSSSSISSSC